MDINLVHVALYFLTVASSTTVYSFQPLSTLLTSRVILVYCRSGQKKFIQRLTMGKVTMIFDWAEAVGFFSVPPREFVLRLGSESGPILSIHMFEASLSSALLPNYML